jgi:hypothetical protein
VVKPHSIPIVDLYGVVTEACGPVRATRAPIRAASWVWVGMLWFIRFSSPHAAACSPPPPFERARAAAQVYTNCSICRAEPCSYHYNAAGMGMQAKALGREQQIGGSGGSLEPAGPLS